MSQLQRYQYTLQANEAVNPSIPNSTFIGCTSGSSIFTVYPAELSPLVLQNGLSAKFQQQFNNVRIVNGAIAQTIELYIGVGELIDSRLTVSGGISIAGNSGATGGAVTVGSSATLIRTANTNRASILLQNLGTSDLYLGVQNTVSASNGILLKADGIASFTMQSNIYGITASSVDVRFIEEIS